MSDPATRPSPPPPPPRRRRWRPPVAVVLILLAAFGAVGWALWSRCGLAGCPDVARLGALQPDGAPLLLDRDGRSLGRLTLADRQMVALDDLPDYVPQAFVAVEDKRFYKHHGVDLRRVGGALLADVRARGLDEGSSTITMQLARNIFPERIPGQDRTIWRKMLEVRVAREIEKQYTKKEILELYLNNIYFGGGARGIAAASRFYFGHKAQSLTLPQAALLAALPKAPTSYDPRRHPEKARERRDLVLDLMAQQGRIPEKKAKKAAGGLARSAREGKAAGPDGALRPLLRRAGARRDRAAVRRLALPRAGSHRHDARQARADGRRARAAAPARATSSTAPRDTSPARLQLRRRPPATTAPTTSRGPWSCSSHRPATSSPGSADATSASPPSTGSTRHGGRSAARSSRSSMRRRSKSGHMLSEQYLRPAAGGRPRPRQDLAPEQLRPPLRGLDLAARRTGLLEERGDGTAGLPDRPALGDRSRAGRRARPGRARCPCDGAGRGVHQPPSSWPAPTPPSPIWASATTPRLILRIERADGEVLWQAPTPDTHAVMPPSVAYLVTDVLRGRRRPRHRRTGAPRRLSRPGRGQDRHHQRAAGRLVRRLHAGPGRRSVDRLRPSATPSCPAARAVG